MNRWKFVAVIVSILTIPLFAQTPTPALLHTEMTGGQLGATAGGDPNGEGWLSLVVPGDGSPVAWAAHVENVVLPAQIELVADPESGLADPILSLSLSSATGAGTATAIPDTFLVSQPRRVTAVLKNSDYPEGAILGRLSAEGESGVYTLPVVGRVPGAGTTKFVTDLRLTAADTDSNPGDVIATIEWWPGGITTDSPAQTVTKIIPAGQVLVLDDVMKNQFGLDQALGAMRVISSRPIEVTARIYNDQVSAGKGTFGQFEIAATSEIGNIRRGVLPHLFNKPIESGTGMRTNIGWFNHTSVPVVISFQAFTPEGTLLDGFSYYIRQGQQQQLAASDFLPHTADIGDFYVIYTVSYPSDAPSDEPLDCYLYAAVTDNVNGDAIFVMGQPR